MAIIKCARNGQSGFKSGELGHCFVGVGAKEQAIQVERLFNQQEQSNPDVKILKQFISGFKPNKKVPEWKFPFIVEAEYTEHLTDLVDIMRDATERFDNPKAVKGFLDRANLAKPSTTRLDGWPEDIELSAIDMSTEVDSKLPESVLIAILLLMANKINVFNLKEWAKIQKSALGTFLPFNEPWLQAEINSFVAQNIQLINNLKSQYSKDLEGIIQRGVQQNLSVKAISDQIQKRLDVVQSRADLIARDQVNKLQGQLTQIRQEQLGVKKYIWHTRQDNKVRETHAAHEGGIFAWIKPPADTGHPGQDYQCRCWPEPLFKGLIVGT